MPSWSIHLAIAKEISKKLNINDDSFLYGNLIPDVDKGTSISRYNAHYYGDLPFPNCPRENMIDINTFISDYKDNISNPLILGHYCHLLTDNFYNNVVYSKCWVLDDNHDIIGIKLKNGKVIYVDSEDKKKIKKHYKHRDFELYGKYLFNNGLVVIPSDIETIVKDIKCLKDDFLDENMVVKRFSYLNDKFKKFNKLSLKEKVLKHNYKLFTKEELDKLYFECIEYILTEIKKLYEQLKCVV